MKRKLLLLFLVAFSRQLYAGTGLVTIVNNLSVPVTITLIAKDDAYFGKGSYLKSNPITYPALSSGGVDECTITVSYGWAVIPGSGYTSCPSTRTIVWTDAQITLSSSSCGVVTGGTSNQGLCGTLGYLSPWYFCPGGEHVTWTTSTCIQGDDVTITINP